MKHYRLGFIALITLFSITSGPTFGSGPTTLAQTVFIDRPDVIYPIPTDDDVIVTMGRDTRSELPAKNISFLVWNLYKGAKDNFKIEYIGLSIGTDIIMNQEIFLDEKFDEVIRFMPQFMLTTATSFFSGKEKIRTGVANISPVKPNFTKFIRTETLEPVVNSPKVTLITSYPIKHSNANLTVVNIHGINFVTTKSFRLELNRIYEQIKNIPPPLVFAGDFNTWNKDRIEILEEYAKKLNLEEARFLPDNRMTFNGYPLDHFLHTPDLKIKKARVDHIYEGSDHKPLKVEVEYSPSL